MRILGVLVKMNIAQSGSCVTTILWVLLLTHIGSEGEICLLYKITGIWDSQHHKCLYNLTLLICQILWVLHLFIYACRKIPCFLIWCREGICQILIHVWSKYIYIDIYYYTKFIWGEIRPYFFLTKVYLHLAQEISAL